MMSNIGLIVEERAADIGNFLVGRLLPFREKRSVGPFIFIDHMEPTCLKEYQNFDVPPTSAYRAFYPNLSSGRIYFSS